MQTTFYDDGQILFPSVTFCKYYIRMLQDYHFVSFFNKLLICRVLGITEWAGSFNFAIVLKSTQRAAMEGRPDRPIKQ